MKRLLRGALLASAVLAPVVLLAEDRKATTQREEFLAALNGPDSHKRAQAVAQLDPGKKEEYELLRTVFEKSDWHLRSKAADVLSKVKNPALVKDMTARLVEKNEKSALVRQGMVMAIARMQDKELIPELAKALADKDWHVRREAAFQLRTCLEKTAVDALIVRWRDEKNPLVAHYIRRSLEDMTKYYLGPHVGAWSSWWTRHREQITLGARTDEEIAKAAEAAKKAEEEGKKLVETTTVTKDVELVTDDIGVGVPVLVLPDYSYAKEVMLPFFMEVEKVAKVQYVELPHISKFKNLPGAGEKPYYPIDKLVDAFEEVRVAAKVDKIAILSSGMTSWIAMRYATRYPKNVVGLIFVSPQSSTEKMKEATDRIQARGRQDNDTELLHYGMSRRYDASRRMDDHEIFHQDRSVPVPEGESDALDRKEFSIRFADKQDSVIDELYPVHTRSLGECLAPEFKVFGEQAVNVPVLVISGKQSILTSESDCKGVADHYNGAMVSFEGSGDFPFIEEPEKFSATVTQFLLKHLGKAKKK